MDIYFQFGLLSSFKSMPNGEILKRSLKPKQKFDRNEIQKYLFKFISKKFNIKTSMNYFYKSLRDYSIRMRCLKLQCKFSFLININIQTKEAILSYTDTLCNHPKKSNGKQ